MYRLSYAQEVGSSFDPDIEDASSWEQELTGQCLHFHSLSSVKDLEPILVPNSVGPRGTSTPEPALRSPSAWAWIQEAQVEDLTPADLDDEEIEAYAEECASRAALAEFEDIPEEELFNWSPDEFDDTAQPSVHHEVMVMDMS
jgi:hypothetical protein